MIAFDEINRQSPVIKMLRLFGLIVYLFQLCSDTPSLNYFAKKYVTLEGNIFWYD